MSENKRKSLIERLRKLAINRDTEEEQEEDDEEEVKELGTMHNNECTIKEIFFEGDLQKLYDYEYFPCIPVGLQTETIHENIIDLNKDPNPSHLPKFYKCEYIKKNVVNDPNEFAQLYNKGLIYFCKSPMNPKKRIVIIYSIRDYSQTNNFDQRQIKIMETNLLREAKTTRMIHKNIQTNQNHVNDFVPNVYTYFHFKKIMHDFGNVERHLHYYIEDDASEDNYFNIYRTLVKKDPNDIFELTPLYEEVGYHFNLFFFSKMFDKHRDCVPEKLFYKMLAPNLILNINGIEYRNPKPGMSAGFNVLNIWYNHHPVISQFFAEIFKQLFAVHQLGYFHKDIHEGNVFVKMFDDYTFKFKLIDWGNSYTLDEMLEAFQNKTHHWQKNPYKQYFLQQFILNYSNELRLAIKKQIPWTRELVRALFLIEIHENVFQGSKRYEHDDELFSEIKFFNLLTQGNLMDDPTYPPLMYMFTTFPEIYSGETISVTTLKGLHLRAEHFGLTLFHVFLFRLFLAEKYADENGF